MAEPLYVDSSVLLTLALAQPGWETVAETLGRAQDDDYFLASSRLLWLESARVATRERLKGIEIGDVLGDNLDAVQQIPITEQTWERAAAIEQHIKTLDAIHLATCELIEATLATVSLDDTIRKVAQARGIPLLPA